MLKILEVIQNKPFISFIEYERYVIESLKRIFMPFVYQEFLEQKITCMCFDTHLMTLSLNDKSHENQQEQRISIVKINPKNVFHFLSNTPS